MDADRGRRQDENVTRRQQTRAAILGDLDARDLLNADTLLDIEDEPNDYYDLWDWDFNEECSCPECARRATEPTP
jgi:hypothetical protein